MIDIKFMKLIYSYSHNDLCLAEIKPEGYMPSGYLIVTGQIDEKDGKAFIRRMQNKYVRGRKRGRFPATDIVKLELQLFMKLKTYRRKLV